MTSLFLIVAIVLVMVFYLPVIFGYHTYVVTSGSMEPEYPVGSLIYVEEVEPEEIEIGDAITFYIGEAKSVATHQVYDINEDGECFRTQGINNRDTDGNIIHDAAPVMFDSLIGKPVLCIPYLGGIHRICASPPGCYVVIALAIVFLISSFIIDRVTDKEKV